MINFNLEDYKKKNRINERVWMADRIQKLQKDLKELLDNAIKNPNEKLGAHKYALKKLWELPDYPHDLIYHKNSLLQVLPVMICCGHACFPKTKHLELKLQSLEFMHPEL